MDLAQHRDRLIAQARATEGVTSLVLFGSAASAAHPRVSPMAALIHAEGGLGLRGGDRDGRIGR